MFRLGGCRTLEKAPALMFCTHQAVYIRAEPEAAVTSSRIWAPRVAASLAALALLPLLYRLPGVHHTEAAHTSEGETPEREMAGRGGAESSESILKYGRGAPVSAQACGRQASPSAHAPGWGVSFFAQAPNSVRVPAFPEARWDTKS